MSPTTDPPARAARTTARATAGPTTAPVMVARTVRSATTTAAPSAAVTTTPVPTTVRAPATVDIPRPTTAAPGRATRRPATDRRVTAARTPAPGTTTAATEQARTGAGPAGPRQPGRRGPKVRIAPGNHGRASPGRPGDKALPGPAQGRNDRRMTELRIAADDVDSLTSDGRVVHLRDLDERDLDNLVALNERVSDQSIYLRYFSPNRESAERYSRRARPSPATTSTTRSARSPATSCSALPCWTGPTPRPPSSRCSSTTRDTRAGIGTLLLEHLDRRSPRRSASAGSSPRCWPTNTSMLLVLRELGFACGPRCRGGEMHVEFAARPHRARGRRDHGARARRPRRPACAPLLAPRSVAVVGAGERPARSATRCCATSSTAGSPARCTRSTRNRHERARRPLRGRPRPTCPSRARPGGHRAAGRAGAPTPCVPAASVAFGRPCCSAPASARRVRTGAAARPRWSRSPAATACGWSGRTASASLNTDPASAWTRRSPVCRTGPGPRRRAVPVRRVRRRAARRGGRSSASASPSSSRSGNKADVGGNDLLLAWAGDPRVQS